MGCTELAELWSQCGLWRKRWTEMVFDIMKCVEFTETLRNESLEKKMLRRSGDNKGV